MGLQDKRAKRDAKLKLLEEDYLEAGHMKKPTTESSVNISKVKHFDAKGQRSEPLNQLNYKEETYTDFLKDSVENHVGSFNLFIDHILPLMGSEIQPCEIALKEGKDDLNKCGELGIRIGLSKLELGKPMKRDCSMLPMKGEKRIFPADCREGHFTYSAPLSGSFYMQKVGDSSMEHFNVDLGSIPIMVSSKACHLAGRTPKQLVAMKEDETERGGYFIMNGNERIIRLLIMPLENTL